MREYKKTYYEVKNLDGITAKYTHCSTVRVNRNDFYYMYNAEDNSMLILRKVDPPLDEYIVNKELVYLDYPLVKSKKDNIPCIILSGLEEFSRQINMAFLAKWEEEK